MVEETSLQRMRTSINNIRRGDMGTHHPSKEQASSRTNTDGKECVKHHIQVQKTNIWVIEKVTDMMEQERSRKSTWAGHVNNTNDPR